MKIPDQASKQPRTESRKSKLRSLTLEQRQALITWLFKEKLTYAVVQQRLAEKFGVSLGKTTIQKFWDDNSRDQLLQPRSEAMLDVIIKAGCSMRLTVHSDGRGISLIKLPQ